MRIKDRIAEIVILREELLKELKALQESCTHDEYHIGTYSWRIGAFDNKRICLECGEILGDPSDNETDEFNKEINNDKNDILNTFNIGQGTKIYKKA